MTNVFVAYASGNSYHNKIIEDASRYASTPARTVTAWSQKDTSGVAVARSVETWIDTADAFVADISGVNDNVTYELGYAIGRGLPTRLTRSSHATFKHVQDIGLLDTLGHDTYDLTAALTKILSKKEALLHKSA
ncbi:hypothetical protein [Cypionkella sp. TWP1-2-1b2]|uniref:hypothetical protein n=1 Tax=Cypionkella sp. TWP1-2-1b2 TaxID=2804675 RepID=UPI003CECE8DA